VVVRLSFKPAPAASSACAGMRAMHVCVCSDVLRRHARAIACLQLCHKMHRRWRSFVRGGSVAFYVFLYSLGFMFNTLHLLSGGLSVMLYLIYMGLMVWGIYLAFGTIGFL
jgi:Endomembrane protein 70